MSLDFSLVSAETSTRENVPETLFKRNITHNLGGMAEAAGVYKVLWRPEETSDKQVLARDITPILEAGLTDLLARPQHFKQYNASNGWGSYDHFVLFVGSVLNACQSYTDALVFADR